MAIHRRESTGGQRGQSGVVRMGPRTRLTPGQVQSQGEEPDGQQDAAQAEGYFGCDVDARATLTEGDVGQAGREQEEERANGKQIVGEQLPATLRLLDVNERG